MDDLGAFRKTLLPDTPTRYLYLSNLGIESVGFCLGLGILASSRDLIMAHDVFPEVVTSIRVSGLFSCYYRQYVANRIL